MQTAVTINQKEAARLKRAAERVVELASHMLGSNGDTEKKVVVVRRRRKPAAKAYTGKKRGPKPKAPLTTPETAALPAEGWPQPAERS